MKKILISLVIAMTTISGVVLADAVSDYQAAQMAFQQGDIANGIKYLTAAAKAGNAPAQYNLSVAYSNGDGVEVNMKTAISWLQKAAAQNYPPAQYDLALYYLSQKQPKKAAPLMKSLADQGDAASQFNYGMMLLRGDGVSKNQELGKQYIQNAANQEFPPAQQMLQQIK